MATSKSKPSATVAVLPVAAKSSPATPFGDGYDMEVEAALLRHLIDADDPDQFDPLYGRYVEYERRLAMLARMKDEYRERDGAQNDVPYREASGVKQLGKLADDGEDSMLLHTREASRLFIGRALAPGEKGYPQSGGKKVGAALRAIWYLSGNDNPYADFALIEAGARIETVKAGLESEITAMQSRLDQLRERGLTCSVVAAVPPAKVELGFKSPYGYSIVHLILSFDYFSRMVKTLVRKDMLTDAKGYDALYAQQHQVRSIFERVIYFQRYLMKDELNSLSRMDWLPNADEAAKKRVRAVVEIFGTLPREVMNGDVVPRHSRRHLDISAEELRLLNSVPLVGSEADLPAAALATLE